MTGPNLWQCTLIATFSDAPLRNQATITMTWCPIQSHYTGIAPISPCRIQIMPYPNSHSAKFLARKQQVSILKSLSLVWLDELMRFRYLDLPKWEMDAFYSFSHPSLVQLLPYMCELFFSIQTDRLSPSYNWYLLLCIKRVKEKDCLKQCIHMCVRARAHARARARILYQFSSFLVKGIN